MQFTFEVFSVSSISNDIFEKAGVKSDCVVTIYSTKERTDTFKFCFEVGIHSQQPFSFRDRVNFTKEVATAGNTEILIAEDDIDPYLFIYLKPNEEAFTIVVDSVPYNERDELIIDSYYSLGWGIVGLEKPLTQDEQSWIIQDFDSLLPGLSLIQIDRTLINLHFRAAQEKLSELKSFSHYYLLSPLDKSVWYSKEEKAKLIVEHLNHFHQNSKQSICVFPVNSSKVENIPGGSDSEEFCILLTEGEQRKIIYKQRRKSW